MKKVAVIGGGLGGLTAAGELAKAGHAVTLFEQSPHLGGKARAVSVDGITLDLGPTLLTLPHLVRAAFERLGAMDLLPRFTALPLQCEYQWPSGERFTAWQQLESTAASAEALQKGSGARMRAFFDDAEAIWLAAGETYLEAPLNGTGEYMVRVLRRGFKAVLTGARLGTLHQLAQRHFDSPRLREFVGRFATYAGASPYEASAAFAQIPHIERAFGVHHVHGGMGALSSALGQAVARLGVTVRAGQPAQWREEGSRFVAGPVGEEDVFDTVVVNADPLRTYGRQAEPLALSGYVLLLAADRRLQLPHHVVRFAHDYPAEFAALFDGRVADDVTFYLCHPCATDDSMAPHGQSGLFVMVNAPALPDSEGHHAAAKAWERHAARLREQCLQTVKSLCPGVGFKVLKERTPVDLANEGAPGGSIYGFLPHGRFGPFRRPKMAAPQKGLFFSGGGTHPGGGVPLVMLSGHFAAQLASQHLGAQA